MKNNNLLLLCLVGMLSVINACSKSSDSSTTTPTQTALTIGTVSDIHYMDPSLLPPNPATSVAFQTYLMGDRKMLVESPNIFQSYINSINAAKPSILLITGDLTKDGELISHQKVASYLQTIKANGTKVYVVPGNHDVLNPEAQDYSQATGTTPAVSTKNISQADFASIYKDFGYGDAIATDPNSLSYVVQASPKLRIIGLDPCLYKQSATQSKNVTAGSFSASTLTWIMTQLQQAKTDGMTIMGFQHHGCIEHFQGQTTFFPEYVIQNYSTIYPQFADNGMKVIFTGHFHAHDITKAANTAAGNFLFDIETGSLVTYPSPYRVINLSADLTTMQITSSVVSSIGYTSSYTQGTFNDYSQTFITNGLNNLIPYLLSTPAYGLNKTQIAALQPVLVSGLTAHYAGDETPSAATQVTLGQLVGDPSPAVKQVALGAYSIWTDLPPKDKNITINLTTGAVTQ